MLSDIWLTRIYESAQLSIALPLIFVLIYFKRFDKTFRLLAVLILVSCIISFIAYLYYEAKKNNLPLLHLYTVVEYSLWSAIYYQLFNTLKAKRLLLGITILFIAFAIANVLIWQPLDSFNSYSRSLETFILMGFAIAWFYKVFLEKNIQYLERHAFFWVNAGVLVYFSGSFLLFIFNDFMISLSMRKAREAWALHGIFLVFHYLLITVGIWMKRDNRELR